jgi:hypothetical protein
LGEQELQNGYALRLSIFEDATGNPSIRKKRCPATPCVPARRDGHYHFHHYQNEQHSWERISIAICPRQMAAVKQGKSSEGAQRADRLHTDTCYSRHKTKTFD